MPNTMTSEYWIGANPIGDAIVQEPLRLEKGFVRVPTSPGLGIAINEEVLLRSAKPNAP